MVSAHYPLAKLTNIEQIAETSAVPINVITQCYVLLCSVLEYYVFYISLKVRLFLRTATCPSNGPVGGPNPRECGWAGGGVVGLLQDFVITYCAPLLPRTPWGRRHQAAYRTSGHKEDTPHKKTQPHRSKGLTAGWVTIKDSRTRISSDYRNVSQYISKRMMLLKVRKSFLLFVSFLL